jgi:hypothetical protein
MGLLDGEAGLHLVREALEGVIEPTTASVVLFDALELGGAETLPGSPEELLAFVRGPLCRVVEVRIGAHEATDVVQRIETTIERITHGMPVRDMAGTTLELPIGSGPVRVLVLSRSSSLAIRLRAALGGLMIAVKNAANEAEARSVERGLDPQIVIVDAMEPWADTDPIVPFLETCPGTTTRILWGEEQSVGRLIARKAAAKKTPLTTVERREGVEPLLDLVRSRQS